MKKPKITKAPSEAALRMRKFRKEQPQHMRMLWRQAYWKRKGITTYDGIALGGMETPVEIRREVDQLRKQLHDWNYQYYVWAAGPPDADWDRAFDRLKELEAKYPQLEDPNSPTKRVGAPKPDGLKVKHHAPMLSLDKAKSPEAVVKFFNKAVEGVVEPKVDGCSLSIKYVNGRMVQAITRGNGQEGEDVTHTARTIRSLPLMLRGSKLTMEVRGEVFIKWSAFDDLNKRLAAAQEETLANPRNAAAGALSVKNPADAAAVPLSFIAYQIVGKVEGEKLERHTEVLGLLEDAGFITPSALPAAVATCPSMYQAGFLLNDLEEIANWVRTFESARRLQDFPTDGLVFKVDDLKLQQELGMGTTFPKWAIAFKYPPDQVKTRIKKIEWTVGKTGKVTPVAEFEPVLVSGSTVARASLCNLDEIKRLDVNVGDEVLIEKSNEIIPKVISVVSRHSKAHAEAPKTCPVCHAPIEHYAGYVDVFCVSQTCKAQSEARLVYAVSKSALDIDGCGPQAIATFVQNGVVTLPALLKSDCSFFKGVTKKKIKDGLEKAMAAPFWRKLSALCIDGWGKQTCQEVATRWPCLPDLFSAQDDKQLDFIVGEVKARDFAVYQKAHKAEFIELLNMGYFPETAEKVEDALKGQSFCITGSIPGCPDRGIAEEEIRNRGGIVKSGVTRKLDFLVVGNEPGNNKLDGARRWGTKCLTPDQLFEMLNWRPTFEAPDPDKEY